MKNTKICITCLVGIAILGTNSAIAACNRTRINTPDGACATKGDSIRCNTHTLWRIEDSYGVCYNVYDCDSCLAGMTRVLQNDISTELCGSIVDLTYYACDSGILCTNCLSDRTWTIGTDGYDYRDDKECVKAGVCQTTRVYRCSANYYGTPGTSKSGCSPCPSSGGVAGKSALGNNTSITGCYIPSGSSFSDGTGSGTYTADCYWTE